MSDLLTLLALVLQLMNPSLRLSGDLSNSDMATSVNRFGSLLSEVVQASIPTCLAINADDEVIVATSERIHILGELGIDARSWPVPRAPDNRSLRLQSLKITSAGEMVATDTDGDRILMMSADGSVLRFLGHRGVLGAEFNCPVGVEVFGSGFLVADARNHSIQALSFDGQCRFRAGHFGHGDGELDHPSDVTVDSTGRIYVADTDNERIVVFDSNGRFLRHFGGAGPYPGLFHSPTGIRCFDGDLYVADSGNHRVQVFDLDGEYKYDWGVHALLPHEGHGRLHYPNQVAIAPSGRFAAVLESFEDRVQIFGPETEESRVLQQSQERSMAAHFGAAIATSGPTMAILEPSTPSILLWDVAGNEPVELSRFGRQGTKAGTFIRPEGVALDPEARHAFVVDPGQMTISVLDITRPKEQSLRYLPELVRFVKSLDVRAINDPTQPIWPIEPAAIRFGPKRDLWVLDAANRRVVVFDEKLMFIRAIAGGEQPDPASGIVLGAESGHHPDFRDVDLPLLEPTDLALSPAGDLLYVVDAARGHVCAFSTSSAPTPTVSSNSTTPEGVPGSRSDMAVRIIGRLGSDRNDFVRPFGIVVAPNGDLYVTDEGGDKVVRFDSNGVPKQSFGKRGIGRVEFFKPKGVTFDAKGDLIVLDWGNHRGQVLTPEGEFIRAFGSRVFVVPTLKKP